MEITAPGLSRLNGWYKSGEKVVWQAASAAVGFAMGGASVLTTVSPFGVAWAGSAPPQQMLATAAGSILGYALMLRGEGVLRYIASLVLLLGLRWALAFIPKSRMQFYTPLMAAVSVLTTGMSVALSGDRSALSYAVVFCETAITATAGILFVKARRSLREGAAFVRTNGICSGITLCVLYMGLSNLTIGGFYPARAAAGWIILCCGCFAGAGAGATAGLAAGLAAALSGQPVLLAPFGAGGLAAGMFSPLGRLGAAGAFAATATLTLMSQGRSELLAASLLETAVACALLMVTPLSLLRRLGLMPAPDAAQGEMLRRIVTARLSRTRIALSEIADITGKVSRRLEELRADPLESMLTRVADLGCRGCKNTPRCWQTGYSDTIAALSGAFAAARSGRRAAEGDFPPHFQCQHVDRLLDALNEQAVKYAAHQEVRSQASQLRTVASDQFEGMSMLIDALQREVSQLVCASEPVSQAAGKFLTAAGAEPVSVCCCFDALERIHIIAEIPSHKLARLDLVTATAELSEITAQELAPPEAIANGSTTRLWWTARAQFAVKTAFVQRACGQNRLCGDSCQAFPEEGGRAVLLLADGMGVGSCAAVDATMTTSLLGRLIRAGVDFDAALRLTNAALLSGGGEERLCTVDAGVLDLYTCRLDLYKAGAAPTFVLRQGRVAKLESASLPAGILGGATAKHTALTLGEGDLIVMLSDGVTDTGAEWIPSQLLALTEVSLEELCENLVNVATERRIDGHEDDMTVMAVRVVRT